MREMKCLPKKLFAKTQQPALALKSRRDVRHQKFRIKPFLKGLREWRGQSPFPGACLPYFRSFSRLLRPK